MWSIQVRRIFMTDKRISPLQWLSTKFASLNHSHSEYLTSHQDITGKEDKSNKVTGILSDSNTDTEYPSAKSIMDTLDDFNSYVIGSFATKSSLNNKENISNKSSSITTDTGSTSKYTTVKAVEDYAQPKGNYLTQHQSLKTINNETIIGTGNINVATEIDIDNDWVSNSENPVQSKVIKSALDNKSNTGHTHQTGDITNLSIPSPSSTVPSADTTNGSVGTGVTWARSNHTHQKSSLYAEANHTHSQYLTSHQDITGKEDKSNKITSLTGTLSESDTDYPSSLVVLNYLDTKEDITNKVTSIGSSSTDDEYPSALCVYDAIDNEATRISNIEDSINDLGNMAFRDTLAEVAGSSDIIDILEQDGYSLFSGDYDDLDNKPTIPTATSDLVNDSGFLTQHQSLTGYLQTSDVKDNLTSTDTNKPLSAKQGKELKTLIDNKPTVTVDSTWIANSTNPIQSKEIKTALDGKSNVIDFYYDNLTDELVINTSTETDFEDLILKEDKSNKVSSWSNTPNDNHYPSEKLVKDYIDEKIGDILEYINS